MNDALMHQRILDPRQFTTVNPEGLMHQYSYTPLGYFVGTSRLGRNGWHVMHVHIQIPQSQYDPCTSQDPDIPYLGM